VEATNFVGIDQQNWNHYCHASNPRQLCELSNRAESHNSSHPVEIGVVARKIGQAAFLQEHDDQRIIAQQAELLAHTASRGNVSRMHWQDLRSHADDVIHGLPKPDQKLQLSRMLFEAAGDTSIRP